MSTLTQSKQTNDQKALDVEFKAWCNQRNIVIPNNGEIDIFLAERKQARLDFARFVIDFPQYVVAESNQKKIRAWLDLNDFPATYENLVAAYESLKPNLQLEESKPPVDPIDPDKPETRPGQWTNGRFFPFDTSAGGSGAMHKFVVGQSTPGASDAEVQIRKRPENMSSEEFARACRSSKAFRDKFDRQ
jgi:hypothetical protein